MRRIGFKTGWIYMNHEEGAYGAENTFTVPFYKERSARDMVRKLAAQAAWPVVLPYFIYLDHFKYNHGFLVGETGAHEIILRLHGYDAEKGSLTGEVFSYK